MGMAIFSHWRRARPLMSSPFTVGARLFALVKSVRSSITVLVAPVKRDVANSSRTKMSAWVPAQTTPALQATVACARVVSTIAPEPFSHVLTVCTKNECH